MIYAKSRKPKRFKCRICDYQDKIKDLKSVTGQFNRDEFIIVKRKEKFAVFTEGAERVNEDDQKAKRWALRKLREG